MTRFAGDPYNPGAALFSRMSQAGPNFANISATSMDETSKTRQSSMFSGAKVASAGIDSIGAALRGQNEGKAIVAGAQAEASAQQSNAMSGMIGDIGGGLISSFKPKPTYGASNFDLHKSFW